ncbi:MAG: hypothetical protein FJ275_09335, partial [Planctomycetes bacterium]|nr:hypothetical protein [Planctomycetota bacterium]
CIERLNVYLRGWSGYFRICAEENVYRLHHWDAHLSLSIEGPAYVEPRTRPGADGACGTGATPREWPWPTGTLGSTSGWCHWLRRARLSSRARNWPLVKRWCSTCETEIQRAGCITHKSGSVRGLGTKAPGPTRQGSIERTEVRMTGVSVRRAGMMGSPDRLPHVAAIPAEKAPARRPAKASSTARVTTGDEDTRGPFADRVSPRAGRAWVAGPEGRRCHRSRRRPPRP